MSKTIQIREVPDEVHAELRTRAAAIGLSLSDYLLREATRIAKRPPLADVLEWSGERGWGVPPGLSTVTELHVPHLIDAEFLSVLRRLEGRRVLTTHQAELALKQFGQLPLHRYPHHHSVLNQRGAQQQLRFTR